MKKYLENKIDELRQANAGLVEIDKNLKETTASMANSYIYLANFINLLKQKTLIEVYNDNFENNEIKKLEKEINQVMKEQEESLVDFIKNFMKE